MVKWRRLEEKDIQNDSLHRWLAWFDEYSPPELIEEVVSMDGAIAEAYKKLEEAKKDRDAYRQYWAERKFEHDRISQLNYARDEGLAQGIIQGIGQGIAQSTLEIARKMKAAGRPSAEIEQFTGLSPEAIEKLPMSSEKL